MGIRLSDIMKKSSVIFVINKNKETRELVLESDAARCTFKYILANFFDTNKISKKDGIIDEKEQIAFYQRAQKYLNPQGNKRLLTRSALLNLKDELFGKKPAQKNISGLRYTFKRHTATGLPAYCTYERNGDRRWYIIRTTGKREFIAESSTEDSHETSFEEIWQKRRPRGYSITDWAPDADYGVIESTGCSPITLNTAVKNGRTVIQSPLCENKVLTARGTGFTRYSNETCVLKFLTNEHAKKFFEALLYKLSLIQAKAETPSKKRPNPRSVSGLWRFYNELLYQRLYTCKRGGAAADSLAIDIGAMVPTPKIEKDKFGNKIITNLWEVDLGWEFQDMLLKTYREVLNDVTGGNYVVAGGGVKSIKDAGPREQQRYINFCTRGMSKEEAAGFKSRLLAEQVRRHDDGFWGNAWGGATLWMEGWDNVCRTGYHLKDVRDAAYAISPPLGQPGSKQRKEYNAFMKLYSKRIKSGELLVFELPTVPSNWATNYFIPQYGNIGNYIQLDNNKAPNYSNFGGAGSGIIVLVKNTPQTKKIYEKAANGAWNVNAWNAFLNSDNWEEFNAVQKRYEMFDQGIEELLDKADDRLKGTEDIDEKDSFDDEDDIAGRLKSEEKSKLILILHALYGLLIGFRIMTDFGVNYVSRAHFIANLVDFIPGIYDIIKLFRRAQKPEDMLQIMFMTVGILSHGKKFVYDPATKGLDVKLEEYGPLPAGIKVTMDIENRVAIIKNNRGVIQKVTGEAFERLLKFGKTALAYKEKMWGVIRERYKRPRKEIHPQKGHKKGAPPPKKGNARRRITE